MKKTIGKTILAALFISTIIVGCTENEVTPLRPAPSISFITEVDYTSSDAEVFAGDTVLIGLECNWNGTDGIKTLTVYVNDVISGSPEIIPDNYAQSFQYLVKIKKSDLSTEKWEFEITDAQGVKSAVSITLSINNGVRPLPTIVFISGGNYTSADKTVLENTEVLVGLNCLWNGIDEIKNITIYKDDIMVGVPVEIPANSFASYSMDYLITKSNASTEVWKFEVLDAFGKTNTVSLTLTREIPVTIKEFTATIGAQENTVELSYYSLSNKLNYNATDAKTNYTAIDFLGSYDVTNILYLASPNSNTLPLPYDLSTWTYRNNTQFAVPSPAISVGEFDAINSDATIIAAYNSTTKPTNKAKNMQVGNVFAFLTDGGKYGIFKVTAATASTTGKVTIQIKMQL